MAVWHIGHFIPNNEKVLKKGFLGIKKDAEERLSRIDKNNPEDAKKIHHRLFNLHESMFLQTNPVPVKTAAEMMGLVSGELRLHLCRMSEELDVKLKGILKAYSLVE